MIDAFMQTKLISRSSFDRLFRQWRGNLRAHRLRGGEL